MIYTIPRLYSREMVYITPLSFFKYLSILLLKKLLENEIGFKQIIQLLNLY